MVAEINESKSEEKNTNQGAIHFEGMKPTYDMLIREDNPERIPYSIAIVFKDGSAHIIPTTAEEVYKSIMAFRASGRWSELKP